MTKSLSDVLIDIASGIDPFPRRKPVGQFSVAALIAAKEIALAHGRIYEREDEDTQFKLRRIAHKAINEARELF